jgi:three-Cys-motif partner protein
MGDKVGPWTEVKLDIVARYAKEYSKILSKQSLHHIYIDAFAGDGYHQSREKNRLVLGSPSVAYRVEPPFRDYYFIDLSGTKVRKLERAFGNDAEVHIYQGNCNEILLSNVFPNCRYDDYKRALCLLDPYSFDYEWRVVEKAGRMGSIELFLHFPTHALNRAVFLKELSKAADNQLEKLKRFWPDDSYLDFYSSDCLLYDDMGIKTANNVEIVNTYCDKLRDIASFKYIPEPLPMKNTKGATVYYLIFATHNPRGVKIVKYIFDKYRNGVYTWPDNQT